ncbi:hypothetical protein [Paracraurococcus lichenis]|uniref:Uncharacterized protein n=1 Tax=Paracraurococcus lichenis TaxID=3064888 RepID=A0ABT9E3H9_9PROT|nr:hypothetical protein [Paracraurococcus sp. LOR1-02]MDO9710721.1 hypothetical protein [Paracraurococcus sp. LOR1-02]
MSPSAHGAVSPGGAAPSFTLPAPRRRIGTSHGAEESPSRLLVMLAVAFLLASPVITLVLSFP